MTVTVCVPVWNGEAFVEQTLESVRAQTAPDIAVLISIDLSDDRSVEVCRAFETKDPRFKVVTQPERLGWIGNVNFLLRQVDTEFAQIMPHDDLIEPTYTERLVGKLTGHPDAVVAYSDLRCFGNRNTVLIGPEATGDLFTRTLGFLYENTAAVAWRGVFRSKVLNAGAYHEEVNGAAADQVWLLRLALQGDLVRVPEILYRKRIHDRSVVAGVRSRKGVPTDSHWADHCVSCHRIALAAGQWTDKQKQAVAAACLARALANPIESMASPLTAAADYALRLSGLAAPGSRLLRPADLPEGLRAHLERRYWRGLVRQALRLLLPDRRTRD